MKTMKRCLTVCLIACMLLTVLSGTVFAISSPTGRYSDYYEDEYEVGNIVTFGSYPQGRAGGDSPIEWIVAEIDGDYAFLISRYCLDCKPYNAAHETCSWHSCSLRSWLNGSFYRNAFSSDEKRMIVTAYTDAASEDNVFIPSAEEVKTFLFKEQRVGYPTNYAENHGAKERKNGACWWWLRDSGQTSIYAQHMDVYGVVYADGQYVNVDHVGVRPAIWVQIDD